MSDPSPPPAAVEEPEDCPFCLEQPSRPRIGPCGHAYCHDCWQNYIWSKAPCFTIPCPFCSRLLSIRQALDCPAPLILLKAGETRPPDLTPIKLMAGMARRIIAAAPARRAEEVPPTPAERRVELEANIKSAGELADWARLSAVVFVVFGIFVASMCSEAFADRTAHPNQFISTTMWIGWCGIVSIGFCVVSRKLREQKRDMEILRDHMD